MLYGILLIALLPLLIAAATKLSAITERYLARLGSSILSLAIIGLAIIGALHLWLKTAKWLVKRKCEDRGGGSSSA